MTPQEFAREARKLGWYLAEHGARHDKYHHPKIPKVLILERHTRDIAKGTLHKLKQMAGMK